MHVSPFCSIKAMLIEESITRMKYDERCLGYLSCICVDMIFSVAYVRLRKAMLIEESHRMDEESENLIRATISNKSFNALDTDNCPESMRLLHDFICISCEMFLLMFFIHQSHS
jgi:hypothetical protein